MKISYNWLKWYVDPLPNADELAEKIIFGAFEVEEKEIVGDDTIFEIKVLPDRAHDCLSHRGIAHEIAGLLGSRFIDPAEKFIAPASQPTQLQIDIQTEKCRRYAARIIRNVKIGPSPDWVVKHLESIGQRSINNIVDATNLVMFDCGQPTHAFDVKKLVSEKIIIRQAKPQTTDHLGIIHAEQITLLGGEMVSSPTTTINIPRTLDESIVVISDENNPLAIAGVKGGNHAEVDTNTTDIVIEVANFDPVVVRKTARRLNILTDSAKRFENELTPELVPYAMRELSATIAEMCPDAVFEDIVDIYPNPVQQRHVSFTIDYINKKLGISITENEIASILDRYGYEYAQDSETFTVAIPFERIDIIGQHDMIEEIGRAYGYEKIEAQLPVVTKKPQINTVFAKITAVKSDLVSKGYYEVMNYTFVKKGDYEVARGPVGKSALRTNLSDGLKESYELNRLNKDFLEIDDMKIFEIGTIFSKNAESFHVAYADKKGVIEKALDEYITENNLEISEYILPETSTVNAFVMWSEYPYIVRDVAVWVSESVSSSEISDVVRNNATNLLVRGPRLFDTFTKDGRTSYAFRMVFQSFERTLQEEEISTIMDTITTSLQNNGWEVR